MAVAPTTPFLPFTREELDQSIPSRFRRQVARHPGRLAVHTTHHSLTYEELDRLSNRIARALLSRLGPTAEAVGILMDQGASQVAAILGVLKAGKFYVPMDASYPPAYVDSILAEAGVALVITDAKTQRRQATFHDLASHPSSEDPALAIASDSFAYIYYTSGSTGHPKGVCDTHRNVLHNIMRYSNSLQISPDDRLTLLQGPAFSGAVSSMFGALLNGATVFPYDVRKDGMGRPLGEWLSREEITIYHSVPMIFRSVLTGGARFPGIRVIRLEGDAASKTDVALFREHFGPDCRLVNGLGTTETGIASQFFMNTDIPLPDGIVPVGYATEDMNVMILDEEHREMRRGVAGEIAVRSAYLATGYWRQPELTLSRFLPGPDGSGERIYLTGDLGRMRADGCLEYLGRKDSHPKIRGHRVEPAEVELALLSLDEVQDAVVTIRQDTSGEARLIAYLVPVGSPPSPLGEAALRRIVAGMIPDYMIPARFVLLDRLPLTANGKIDRQALPPADRGFSAPSVNHVPARNPLEARLVELWEELLDRRPIGVTDNFFALGGDSVGAAGLLVALETIADHDLPPSSLVDAPTIDQLAGVIRKEGLVRASALVPIQPRGTLPPFFMVHGHTGRVGTFGDLPRALGADQRFYGLQSIGWWADRRPHTTIEAMAAHYIEEMKNVQAAGPYHLGGNSYGSVVASEMAHQLRARGEEIALLFFMFNTPADFPGLVPPAVLRRFRRLALRRALAERIRTTEAGQRIGWHAERLWQLEASARVRYLFRLIRRVVARSAREVVVGRPATAPRPRATPGQPPVSQLNLLAQKAYRPRPLSGRVTMILHGEDRSRYSVDPAGDWGQVAAGGYDIHFVPWRKGLIYREPHVRALAEHLRAALRHSTS